MADIPAMLCLQSYAGRTEQLVVVVGETPKRYRIRALKWTRLGGGSRFLRAGDTALVPKYAVRFHATPASRDGGAGKGNNEGGGRG